MGQDTERTQTLVRVVPPSAASLRETRDMLERTQSQDQHRDASDMRRAGDGRDSKSSGFGTLVGITASHPN